MEKVFTYIYENKIWGNNENENYSGSSGDGSSIEFNTKYIEILKKIINHFKIKSVVDLGCGDFRIGKLVYDDLDIKYTGYDTYKKVIDFNLTQYPKSKYSFKHLDFFEHKESIETADLCILKDVLQHWTLNHIYIFLDYLVASKKFKYILLVNCCKQNNDDEDCILGHFRNLKSDLLPLKKYYPFKIDNYHTKEISIIKV